MLLGSREGAVTQGSPVLVIVVVGLDPSSSSCGCLLLFLCRQSPLLLLPPHRLKLLRPLPILAAPRPIALPPLAVAHVMALRIGRRLQLGFELSGCFVRPFFPFISFPAAAYSSLISSSAKSKTIPGRRHCHHFILNPIVHRLFHRCRCPDLRLTIPNLLEVP